MRDTAKGTEMERVAMSWNNECVDMLKKLGAAGQLASHIAKELGCVT